MSELPLVSVCIANYNGSLVIDECIESVLKQKCDFAIELIVHDDSSTDSSAKLIATRYPQVLLLRSEMNVGFCVANNRMVDRASGKYVLLLNNDAVLLSNSLAELFKTAIDVDRPAILSLPQYDYASGELMDIGSMLDPFFNPVPNRSINRNGVAMVMGACLWIPRQLWYELGGFPDWFGSVGEDLYLCSRARLAGILVHAIASSGYRHHVGASFGGGKVQGDGLSTTFQRRALSERNKTFVMITCSPISILVLLLPLHLGLIHLEGAILSVVKGDINVWRTIYAPLLPSIWKRRKELLTLRRCSQSQRHASLITWLAKFSWAPWKLKMLLRHGLPRVT